MGRSRAINRNSGTAAVQHGTILRYGSIYGTVNLVATTANAVGSRKPLPCRVNMNRDRLVKRQYVVG